MKHFDVVVIGAGAAGMMAAAVAGQRGRKVLLIDHADKLAEKIRISGGGRCNFTNLYTAPAHFISNNPHFCRSALARYTPQDFIGLIEKHGIAYHEKHKGQLFCDGSSEQIIDLLRRECDAGQVRWRMPCSVADIAKKDGAFRLTLEEPGAGREEICADKLVMATGGLSIPKIGATDFSHRIARQFGLKIIEPRPALVPLSFSAAHWASLADLAGVALEVEMRTAHSIFREDLLFTHRGLSGPAVLQSSSYWNPGESLHIDLAPDVRLIDEFKVAKAKSRKTLGNVLSQFLPKNLAQGWLASQAGQGISMVETRIADLPDKFLRALAESLQNWTVQPDGTEGFRKAEVTRGGIDTRALSQQSMEALSVTGLYFIGEAVDVTGWLGGYNFQWAWASGVAAGRAL